MRRERRQRPTAAFKADAAAFAPLVAAELAEPDESAVLQATIDVGDLSDQGALDALRRGIVSITVKAPPVGA